VISSDDVVHRAPILGVSRTVAVVTKGLSPSERVVVNGQYNLAKNVKVKVEPAKSASATP
jgi:hypothetical protein